jgi:hypothetical protein
MNMNTGERARENRVWLRPYDTGYRGFDWKALTKPRGRGSEDMGMDPSHPYMNPDTYGPPLSLAALMIAADNV